MNPIYNPTDIDTAPIVCLACDSSIDTEGRCKCRPPTPTLDIDPHTALYWRPWESNEAGAVTVRVTP